MWAHERRPELLRLFQTEVYGAVPVPAKPIKPKFHVRSQDNEALAGKAIRREVVIAFSDQADGPRMDLLIYLPKQAGPEHRVPAFLGLNFNGNQAISPDPGITLSRQWVRNDAAKGITDHRATEADAGLRRFALAGRADRRTRLRPGDSLLRRHRPRLRRRVPERGPSALLPARPNPPRSRRMGLDRRLGLGPLAGPSTTSKPCRKSTRRKSSLMGHSRLGKTALWAGAQDPRFAIVISNNSGAGGAALSRRIFGETAAHLNQSFPHWFCANFHKFSNHEELLPVDQHELIALIAPRPVLICSAVQDLWADPKGEFLSALAADPVYRLLGTDGLAVTQMPKPAVDSLVKSTIGYRIRPGKHDVTGDDWDAYLAFADYHLGSRPEAVKRRTAASVDFECQSVSESNSDRSREQRDWQASAVGATGKERLSARECVGMPGLYRQSTRVSG